MSKIYFASDFHLGMPNFEKSRQREDAIVRWLSQIEKDASAIYLIGDLFDFWHEYAKVVPRGYIRLLGKLAQLVDQGIEVNVFTGNHDMWMFGYLEEEIGLKIYRAPIQVILQGKKFFIGHGDGLGPGDRSYKILKKVFSNRVCQWLFARIHPNLSFRLAQFWSKRSRESHTDAAESFKGKEKEWLYQFANEQLDKEFFDFFIFGHRHLPFNFTLKNGRSRYLNSGDWIFHNSYLSFDGESVQLHFFEKEMPTYLKKELV